MKIIIKHYQQLSSLNTNKFDLKINENHYEFNEISLYTFEFDLKINEKH